MLGKAAAFGRDMHQVNIASMDVLMQLAQVVERVRECQSSLIDALESNEVDLDDLAKDELSAEMQAMSEPEQKTYLRNKTRQRNDIKAKIKNLAVSRDSYLAKESRERMEEGKVDSFDDKLLGTIRLQAAKKGIVY